MSSTGSSAGRNTLALATPFVAHCPPMDLRTLAKHARSVHRAVSGGREQVRQLRDAADVTLGMFDAIGGVTGHLAKNPTVGSLAGVAAAAVAHFTPQAPAPHRAPVQSRPASQKPKRVTVEVIDAVIEEPTRKAAR